VWTWVASILLLAFLGLMIWSVMDIVRNRNLRWRTKMICAWAIVLAPVIGLLVYVVVRQRARSRTEGDQPVAKQSGQPEVTPSSGEDARRRLSK
jgi:heme/copper-type cytochrome/quinol oxidase subunit 2